MKTRVIQDEPKPDEAAQPAPEAGPEDVKSTAAAAEPRVAEQSAKGAKP
jgi:hypothetical protein